MSERQNTRVTVHSQSVYGSIVDKEKYEDDTVTEVVAWLQGLLADVPPEFRARTYVDFSSVGDYEGGHRAEIEVYYVRPETDAEMEKRLSYWRERSIDEKQRYERQLAAAVARLADLDATPPAETEGRGK